MRTQKDFERDFAELIELGDIFIEHEVSEYSIFILADGTPVDACFDLGYRSIDHNTVLCHDDYTMEEMVTIEPERHAILVDTTQLTNEQLHTLKGYSNMWDEILFYDIENDCITEQVNELLSVGYDLVTAITIASDPNYLD